MGPEMPCTAATPEATIPVDSDENVFPLELGKHGLPHAYGEKLRNVRDL